MWVGTIKIPLNFALLAVLIHCSSLNKQNVYPILTKCSMNAPIQFKSFDNISMTLGATR